MKLSVVIPTHNRDSALRKTLEAIAQQTLPREQFEVVIVDDGSQEDCRRRIRELAFPLGHRLIEKPQGGLASARNRGSDEAAGEILHFLDDDVMPAPDSFRRHLESHAAQEHPVAVVGSLPYPAHVRIDAFLWYVEQSGHYDLYRFAERKYPDGKPPMPPLNGNSSIPREVFFRVGKYDETFRQYGSEDLELGYRLAREGVPFVYDPQAIGYHDHVKNFGRFCVDMERAGESLIQLYRKYPEIKAPKKIDLVEDRLSELPRGKRLAKVILETTFAAPFLLSLPRILVRAIEPHFALRHVAFPFFRWIAYYHYAVGMRRGLTGPG